MPAGMSRTSASAAGASASEARSTRRVRRPPQPLRRGQTAIALARAPANGDGPLGARRSRRRRMSAGSGIWRRPAASAAVRLITVVHRGSWASCDIVTGAIPSAFAAPPQCRRLRRTRRSGEGGQRVPPATSDDRLNASRNARRARSAATRRPSAHAEALPDLLDADFVEVFPFERVGIMDGSDRAHAGRARQSWYGPSAASRSSASDARSDSSAARTSGSSSTSMTSSRV